MTELQLGKYEFYPNEEEIEKKDRIDSFFERYGSDLNDKSIEELLEEINNGRN
jgi:hypothetical protein